MIAEIQNLIQRVVLFPRSLQFCILPHDDTWISGLSEMDRSEVSRVRCRCAFHLLLEKELARRTFKSHGSLLRSCRESNHTRMTRVFVIVDSVLCQPMFCVSAKALCGSHKPVHEMSAADGIGTLRPTRAAYLDMIQRCGSLDENDRSRDVEQTFV